MPLRPFLMILVAPLYRYRTTPGNLCVHINGFHCSLLCQPTALLASPGLWTLQECSWWHPKPSTIGIDHHNNGATKVVESSSASIFFIWNGCRLCEPLHLWSRIQSARRSQPRHSSLLVARWRLSGGASGNSCGRIPSGGLFLDQLP